MAKSKPNRKGQKYRNGKGSIHSDEHQVDANDARIEVASSLPSAIFLAIICSIVSYLYSSEPKEIKKPIDLGLKEQKLAHWQSCGVFMAPTNNSATGWGVFAARDFQSQELLDITPLFVDFEVTSQSSYQELRLIKGSQLDDYVYGVHRRSINKHQKLVLFGYEMVYNHHPEMTGLQFGLGPGYSQGFFASGIITAGQELFSNYGKSDGGETWFQKRGLTMRREDSRIEDASQLVYLREKYCTKIHAGPGRGSYQNLIPNVNPNRLAPFDAGLFDARAKMDVTKGEELEIAPVMLLYESYLKDTALAPIAISWNDLLKDHQDSLIQATASTNHRLPVHTQNEHGERLKDMVALQKIAILPFAGRIGMVRRVTGDMNVQGNCRLDITVEWNDDYPYIILRLVATREIATGEPLLVELKMGGTSHERSLLKLKLDEIGYPHNL